MYHIEGGNFTDNNLHFIMASWDYTSSDSTTIMAQTLLSRTWGTGTVKPCLDYREFDQTFRFQHISCYAVVNMTSDRSLSLHGKVFSAGATVVVDNFSVVWIDLTASGLEENVDYFMDVDDVRTDINTETTMAQVEVQPTQKGEDWAVFTSSRLESNEANCFIRTYSRHNGTTDEDLQQSYTEDINEFFSHRDLQIRTLNGNTTFSNSAIDFCTSATYMDSSRVFALRLPFFDDYHWYEDNDNTIFTAPAFDWDNQHNMTYTPSHNGNYIMTGQVRVDINAVGRDYHARLQNNNTDVVEQTTSGDHRVQAWDANDFFKTNQAGVSYLTTNENFFEADADGEEFTVDRYISGFGLVFSVKKAATGQTINLSDDFTLEDDMDLILMGVMQVSDEFTLEDSISFVGMGEMTLSDDFVLDDSGVTFATNAFLLQDEFALEDDLTFVSPQRNFNAIILRLNSPDVDRLGGVYAITCPSNHTLTGILSNGTPICTDLSSFFTP